MSYVVNVEDTFRELGIKSFRFPKGYDRLLIRTHPIPDKVGSVYIAPKLSRFYGELPNMQQIVATVLAAGSECTYKVGDNIAFMRLHFAAWQVMEDGTRVGWINESQTMGWVEYDQGDGQGPDRRAGDPI